MYQDEKYFFKNNCYQATSKEGACLRLCALNDLIAGDSFSGCQYCVFKDNLNIMSEFDALCSRFANLGCV